MTTSIRIVATYEKEKCIATSIERVEILTPASDSLDGFNNLIGFWLELRSNLDKRLYRLIMRDPFQAEVEVFNLNKDQTISGNMMPRDKISGHLVLLVPDHPDAYYVALVRSKINLKSKKLDVKDVIRIPIKINKKEGFKYGKI